MPIYEFYCSACHTVFNFLARRVNVRKRPACPRCGRPRLERRASSFAVVSGAAEEHREDLPEGLDPSRMERAMEGLAREAGSSDSDDPKAMAGLMRRFYESSGVAMGQGMSEALRRLEAGEDPDAVEAEMGDVLESEDPFGGRGPSIGGGKRTRRPAVDPQLYEL